MKKKLLFLITIAFISICFLATKLLAEESTNNSSSQSSIDALRLWLPYDPKNPNDLQNLDENFIFIDFNDLKSIQNSINPTKRYSGAPPVNYQINSAAFFASVNGDYINIQGVYNINKLDNEWVLIPVISDQVGISTSLLDDKPAFITNYNSGQDFSKFKNYSQIGSGYQFIALKNKGIHKLKLNFTVKKITNSAINTESFIFTIPSISMINISCFVANQKNLEFEVPSSISKSIKSNDKGSILSATLPPMESIEVKWNPKSYNGVLQKKSTQNAAPSVNSTSYTKIDIGRGSLTGTTTFDIDIRHSALSHFDFLVPNDIEIDSVTSANNIEISDPYPDIKNGILPVDLTSSVEGKLVLTIKFRKNFDDSSFQTKVPYITLNNKNIDRENGYVAIAETTNIETNILKTDTSKDYQEIDSSELPGILSGLKASIAIKYTKTKQNIKTIPYDITIDVQKHQDVAVYEANIDSTNIVSVLNEQGQIFTKTTFNIRNTKKQFLDITLPLNSSIWSVYVDGKSTKPAIKDISKQIYSIPLAKSSTSDNGGKEFPVEIVYMTDSSFFPPVWLFGMVPLNSISTELSTNSLNWSVYTPANSKFIPLDLFSNLQKTISTTGIMQYGSDNPFDSLLLREKGASSINSAMPAAKSVEESSRVNETNSLYDQLDEKDKMLSGGMKKEQNFYQQQLGFRQDVFQSRKIGKMPVYIYLPQVGNAYSFYQLSFQANKTPFLPIFYIDNLLFNICLWILMILFMVGIPYLVIKNKYKSWKYILTAVLLTYILHALIGLKILLLIYIVSITMFVEFIRKNKNKSKLKQSIILGGIIFAVTGLIISYILHPPLPFLLVFIFMISIFIVACIAFVIWLVRKIILYYNKRKDVLNNNQADQALSSNMEGQDNE